VKVCSYPAGCLQEGEAAVGLLCGLRSTQEMLNSQDSPAKAVGDLPLPEQSCGCKSESNIVDFKPLLPQDTDLSEATHQ